MYHLLIEILIIDLTFLKIVIYLLDKYHLNLMKIIKLLHHLYLKSINNQKIEVHNFYLS
jgi:hypothetical protein